MVSKRKRKGKQEVIDGGKKVKTEEDVIANDDAIVNDPACTVKSIINSYETANVSNCEALKCGDNTDNAGRSRKEAVLKELTKLIKFDNANQVNENDKVIDVTTENTVAILTENAADVLMETTTAVLTETAREDAEDVLTETTREDAEEGGECSTVKVFSDVGILLDDEDQLDNKGITDSQLAYLDYTNAPDNSIALQRSTELMTKIKVGISSISQYMGHFKKELDIVKRKISTTLEKVDLSRL